MLLKTSNSFSQVIFERRFELALCLIVAWAFLLRAWGATSGLPMLNVKDEGQMIPAAVRFGSGDFNPHSFTYPSLYKYLLFFLYGIYFAVGRIFGTFSSVEDFKLHYFNDPSDFYVIARVCSALLGALTVLMVYFIGKQLHSNRIGLVAALLFSVDFQHLRYSHLAKPDVAMIFLMVTAIYFACRIATAGALRNYIWAGVFGGLAISAKYNAVTVVIPIVVAHLLVGSERNFFLRLRNNFHYLILSLSLVGVFFFVGTPFALFDYRTFGRDLEFVKLVVSRGDAGHDYLSTVAYYFKEMFLPGSWSWQGKYAGLLILAGLLLALFRRRRQNWIILSFIIVHFFYFTYKTSSDLPKPHYLLPLLPLMFIFAAQFLEFLTARLKTAEFFKTGALAVVVILLMLAPTRVAYFFNYELSRESTDERARNWILENVPSATRILQVGRHSLALPENRQSLKENSADSPPDVLQSKIKAVTKFPGNTYYICRLDPGWNVTEEIVQTMEELPLGVKLPESEMFNLSYWLEKEVQLVVIMGERQGVRGSFLDSVHISLLNFGQQLETEAQLVTEFVPEEPHVPGRWIRIYE
ncbi:MAG TPA: glycosyltransferase family 39 protein, partial [bacterium]